MLSPADRCLVERDAALRGLAAVLDRDAVAEILAAHWPALRVSGPPRPTYVRYKPGRSCLAGYAVEAGSGEIHVLTQAFAPDQRGKMGKIVRDGRGDAGSRAEAVLVEHLDLAISLFPDDPDLPRLSMLRTHGVRRVARRLGLRIASGTEPEVEIVGYRPRRRCVLRIMIDGEPRAVIKFHRPEDFAAVTGRARRILPAGRFQPVRPVGADPRLSALAYPFLSGSAPGEPGDWRQTGEALAHLHRSRAPGLAPLDPAALAGRVGRTATDLAALHPALGRRALALALRLRDRLPDLNRLGPAHGDFHGGQVLCGPDVTAMIDFDEACLADPAVDIGNLAAHAERDSGLSGHDHVLDPLIEGYRSVGDAPAIQAIRTAVALGLLMLAPHSFRGRDPDWPARTDEILSRAEALLAPTGIARGRPPARDPMVPLLDRASDPLHAAEGLAGCGWTDAALRVSRAEIVRHKHGRRALVAYDVELASADGGALVVPLLGKIRSKGLDRRSLDLQRVLWTDGFGPDAADGVMVAEPIGGVPDLAMWFQRRMGGRSVADLAGGADDAALGIRAAEAIHKLHRLGPPTERVHGIAEEITILEERLAALQTTEPALAPEIASLRETCRNLAGAIGPAAHTPIHRDFYPDHVLIDGPRTILIDLDLYAMGDPALDVGNFYAHLIEAGIRVKGHRDAYALVSEAFFHRSADLGDPDLRRRAGIYAALSMARLVAIGAGMAERRKTISKLLEASACMADCVFPAR